MKKYWLIALVAVVVFAIYWFKFRNDGNNDGPKTPPLKTSRHSDDFNKKVDSLLTAYLEVQKGLVEGDTIAVKTAGQLFSKLTGTLSLEELKKDTTGIYESAVQQLADTRANAESLLLQSDVTEMRKDYHMVSENIYPLLKTIHYEGQLLYWQYCANAFGENSGGSWISTSKNGDNPYLGKNASVPCAEVKDSIKAL